jgi:hypothetical protein
LKLDKGIEDPSNEEQTQQPQSKGLEEEDQVSKQCGEIVSGLETEWHQASMATASAQTIIAEWTTQGPTFNDAQSYANWTHRC